MYFYFIDEQTKVRQYPQLTRPDEAEQDRNTVLTDSEAQMLSIH